MKIAVVTDSSAYLTQQQIEQNNIFVLPIPVIIDGTTYLEGKDITTQEFYQKLQTAKNFPTTSQPPLGEVLSLYQKLKDDGYDTIISIHLASTISGFLSSLNGIKDEIDGLHVIPFDSQITVMLMGQMAIAAAKMAQRQVPLSQILSTLERLRATTDEYFIVDDLQNLVRGGRLSNAQALIGSVLKIKPILTFDDETHRIVAFEKVRSTKRAKKRVEELFKQAYEKIDYPVRIIVIHADDEEAAIKWQTKLQKQYPDCPVDISYFGPVIGTHLGKGALALAWMEDIDKI